MGKVYNFIDVSEWQGKIDWKKVKADGIDGAIIRYADGSYLDKKFDYNMKNAIAAGLHVGCYIFSRAKDKDGAEKEATRLFKAASKYKFDMPLYIDLEDNKLRNYADTVAAAFLDKMKALGAIGGVYANLNWWNNYLKKTAKNYSSNPFWIAQYYTKVTHKTPSLFGMWQYTSSGRINGISGRVDRDRCYIAYWDKKTKPEKAGAAPTPATPTTLQKAISAAAKAQVAWSKDSVYKWEKQPNIIKSKTHGTCVTYVACVLQRIGVISAGSYVWTNGRGFGDGKVIGANGRMEVTYYNNKKTIGDIKKNLQIGDILIFDDNESGKVGDCGHICIYNGGTYNNGIHTYTGGHNISTNGKEKYKRKVLAVVRIKSMPERKTIDELAHEVIDGKWGSGEKRRENIINAGYDYDKVQERVNQILAGTSKKGYTGTLPSTKLIKTNAEVIADAIKFGKWIAGDNTFHYGYTNKHGSENPKDWSPNAHHNGCYFCETNTDKGGRSKKGIVDYEHTYCCNPLIGACWAHGGCVPKALELCKKGTSWNFAKGTGYDKSKLFTNLGKPKKADLKAGDVLCSDSHVAMYIGGGKIVEAAGGDDNKKGSEKWNNSIHVTTLTDKRYEGFKRVHRFNGSVNTTCCMFHGEVGARVVLLQKFLKWYGYDITVDGLFGDATFKAVKAFQKAAGITADGVVGPNTITAMGKAVK